MNSQPLARPSTVKVALGDANLAQWPANLVRAVTHTKLRDRSWTPLL